MAIINISSFEEFEKQVLEGTGRIVVDFWASWCGPCQMMHPVIEQLAEQYPVTVCKVNVDEVGAAAQQCHVDSIPAFFVFQNGRITAHTVGAMPLEMLASRLGL